MSKLTRGVKSWVELPAKAGSQRTRKDLLRNWVLGNKLLESVPDTHNLSEEQKTKVWQTVYQAAERGISWGKGWHLNFGKIVLAIGEFYLSSLAPALTDDYWRPVFLPDLKDVGRQSRNACWSHLPFVE